MSTQWPKVKLKEVARPIERAEVPSAAKIYRQIGVKLWGQGAYEREPLDGSQTRYSQLFRAESNDIIVNKIWARNGSVAVVPEPLAGCYGSSEFPMFAPDPDLLHPRWMHWLTKTQEFWTQCDQKSQGTSGKNRIRRERFLEIEIPLPPLPEQRRIVAWIENLAEKTQKVRDARKEFEAQQGKMLLAIFSELICDSTWLPIADVAPITRRPAQVKEDGLYAELGIRSFGRGTFHKPSLTGIEVGTKKLFYIEPGDLVLNNVFAWEGAVAVASPEDAGRVGSHRYITCVPTKGLLTAHFLCFYFLTDEGLKKLGDASPGGAGRNRTLGLEALSAIEVPVPNYTRQLWFENVLAKAGTVKRLQAESTNELEALVPSFLNKVLS